MSRIDIAKLTPTTPVSGAGSSARSGALAGKLRSDSSSPAASGAGSKGISVEVSNRIEAGQPPVDGDRVAAIRAALRDGSYPIVPTEIADALIAARLMMGYDS